jgi:glycosyltransferase involved in cell wall biosynthesis
MSDDVVVSICCIAYNQEKFIRKTVDSFLMQQTNFKFEILIHDDASTDRTADIIREYERRYPNLVRTVIQKENKYKEGMMSGYFYGYEPFSRYLFPLAKGKYLALCEGDDYWTDNTKLQKQVEYLESHPKCSMCFHRTDMLFENGRRQSFNPNGMGDRYFTSKELIATPSGIATASKMLRNYYNDQTRQDYLDFSGDCLLTTYYGIYGDCGFVDNIKPSVYKIHSGGVWSGKTYYQQKLLVWNMYNRI